MRLKNDAALDKEAPLGEQASKHEVDLLKKKRIDQIMASDKLAPPGMKLTHP